MNLKTLLIMAWVTFSPAILLGQNASAQSDTLKTVNRLKEVVVRAYGAERNLKAPEMGRVSLSSNMIANLPVMFGEPDIVKALQTLPGVSQGMEGFTGLYVRGGDNDQNLFLYQGLPLYHVSHLGGIFSSFNVETVDRVDFYKASFPARYGGRISSITDIAMREPDFNKFGGKVSVGLLNANVYVTGPIIKGRTAFSAGLRRSWIDLLSAPTLAIVNAITKKEAIFAIRPAFLRQGFRRAKAHHRSERDYTTVARHLAAKTDGAQVLAVCNLEAILRLSCQLYNKPHRQQRHTRRTH